MRQRLEPTSLGKVPLGDKVKRVEVKGEAVMLSTRDQKIKWCVMKGAKGLARVLPIGEVYTQSHPTLFTLHDKSIIYADHSLLHIGPRSELHHDASISHLLVDDSGIAMTAAGDQIMISGVSKAVFLANLHHYGSNITSLQWHNSLAISGNATGQVTLWDINRQKVVRSTSLFTSPVTQLGSHVDFLNLNVYHALAADQRRMAIFDLRTHRTLKIINDLPPHIFETPNNPAGKIFLMSLHQVSMIDLYHNLDIMGSFKEKAEKHGPQSPLLTCGKVWDHYLIAGCSEGSIRVYDTDTLHCLYGFGVCESGAVKQLKRVDQRLLALSDEGVLTAASMGSKTV